MSTLWDYVVMLLALVESLQSQVPRWSLWILFGMPDVAGASGCDHSRPTGQLATRNLLELRPVTMTVALGFWASGVSVGRLPGSVAHFTGSPLSICT
jgi:hypothetical protein